VSARAALELTLPAHVHASLYEALFTADGCENFAVLFCSASGTFQTRRLLVREWWQAPANAYHERLEYHLEIAPHFLNEIVSHAIATRLNPVIVHSHPGADVARYSKSDDFGEGRLLPVLAQLAPGATVASLLFATKEIRGRYLVDGQFIPLDRVSVLGTRVAVFSATSTTTPPATAGSNQCDRQRRALGAKGLERLRSLRVAVVGAGGTGSAVLEQLARLGVRDIVVVDPDALELSNLPRVWGSFPQDAEQNLAKVDVSARHLGRISSDTTVVTIQDSVTRQSVLERLRDRDLVFGCTDNHWSRAVLNRFAHQHLVPLVDMGVRLDSRSGEVVAAAGQVTIAGPGYACLRCSHLISAERVRLECMPDQERRKLGAEGYVMGLDDPAPSVISLNTTIASMAVTAAISLFANLTGGEAQTSIRYDARSGETFVVATEHDPSCDICGHREGVVALGDAQPVSAYD
jgi:molybdopterin-synthase adenylyltransferase